MNKKDLVRAVSEDLEMTQKLVGEVVDAVFANIEAALVNGDEVAISGFGKFVTVEKEEKTARNPQTGAEIIVPAHRTLKFKASQSLKEAVK